MLVLDSLEDPQNVGTLLRSAEASGVHGAIFPTHRQAPLTPAAVKASAGAVEHLRLAPVDDLPGALADLHARGLRIVGADGDAALTAREADLRGPIAIVVGSEGRGLGPAVRRRCDLLVRIPMHGHIESLNAAVAGSILLYEAAAQRGLADAPAAARDRVLRRAARGSPLPGPRPRLRGRVLRGLAGGRSRRRSRACDHGEAGAPRTTRGEAKTPPAAPRTTRGTAKAQPVTADTAPDEDLLPGGPVADGTPAASPGSELAPEPAPDPTWQPPRNRLRNRPGGLTTRAAGRIIPRLAESDSCLTMRACRRSSIGRAAVL